MPNSEMFICPPPPSLPSLLEVNRHSKVNLRIPSWVFCLILCDPPSRPMKDWKLCWDVFFGHPELGSYWEIPKIVVHFKLNFS